MMNHQSTHKLLYMIILQEGKHDFFVYIVIINSVINDHNEYTHIVTVKSWYCMQDVFVFLERINVFIYLFIAELDMNLTVNTHKLISHEKSAVPRTGLPVLHFDVHLLRCFVTGNCSPCRELRLMMG